MDLSFALTRLLIRLGMTRWVPHLRRHFDAQEATFLRYFSRRALAVPFDDWADCAALPSHPSPDVIHLAEATPRFESVPVHPARVASERRGLLAPMGLPELRNAIAETFLLDQGVSFHPGNEILVTNGASAAFATAVDAFVDPGSAVVLFDPTSPLFPLLLKHQRARIRWVPTWCENGQTRFHLEPFVRALRGARMLVLCDPANPTGTFLAAEDLEQILWWTQKYDVLVYLDESFAKFDYHSGRRCLAAIPQAKQRTLIAGSVSKSFGLPTVRVGWLAGPRPLLRVCVPLANCHTPLVSSICQQIALAAMRLDEDRYAPLRAELVRKRDYVLERLRALGLAAVQPLGTFFVWCSVASLGQTGRSFADELFRQSQVLVSAGEAFGVRGTSYVRLNYAVDEGRLREGMQRLTRYVEQRRTRPSLAAADTDSAQAA